MRIENAELRIKRIWVAIYALVLVGLIAALVLGTLADRLLPSAFTASIRPLSGFTCEIEGGGSGKVSLPHSFESLPPRTAVTLYAEVEARPRESLYIKTLYAPLRLYADDRLIYECGQDGSYPGFFPDPPTIVTTVPLPDADGVQRLRFEYLFPTQRGVLTLPAVLAGDEVALIVRLFEQTGFSLLFSLILIFMGVILILLALTFLHVAPGGTPFLWLGLFALLTGVWGLGECNLTAFLIPYPSLLYIMAFTGLFTLAIPLLRFATLILNPHPRVRTPLAAAQAVLCAAAAGAFLLQLMGLCGLHSSMYLFHALIPLSFLLLAVCVIWEYARYRNPAARRFAMPMLVLSVSSVLELINYQFRFTNVLSLFFQLGMLIFIFSLGVIGGNFTREALRTQAEKTRLETQMAGVSRLLDMQREQYKMLTDNITEAKAARHDLRHQLAVMKGYLSAGDISGALKYYDEMAGSIPGSADKSFCDNFAVNAVVTHYLARAARGGTEASVRTVVPSVAGRVQDSDLCIMFGNLLENAVEACERMEGGEKTIKLRAQIRHGNLTITVDNSFDGTYTETDGVFFSRKREGEGIGLSSVRAIAEKYGGALKCEVKGNVFMASVYVKMGENEALQGISPG